MNIHKRPLISLAIGVITATALYKGLDFAGASGTHHDKLVKWLIYPQMPGFLVFLNVWGMHGSAEGAGAFVWIMVNAIVYALVVYGLSLLFCRKREVNAANATVRSKLV